MQQFSRPIRNLRQVYCGYLQESDVFIRAGLDFLEENKPGIFVVAGTNLLGKSTIVERIKERSGLKSLAYLPRDLNEIGDPNRFILTPHIEFSDEDGKPKPRSKIDNYALDIMRWIDVTGIKKILLPEVWVGHEAALKAIGEKLIKGKDCSVILDVVSSHEGAGFFDSEANNRFIQEALNKIFQQSELRLYLLSFDREALRDGVMTILSPDFVQKVLDDRGDDRSLRAALPHFSRDQIQVLMKAICESGWEWEKNVKGELSKILGLPNAYADVERR